MVNQAHFFFALELPLGIKAILEESGEALREAMHFKSWVHPADLHITLAFLGHVEASQLETANTLVAATLNDFPPFELAIDHLGIFGRPESPRIFWAGLKESTSLNESRERVYKACIAAGISLEQRPFSPHITLARKWVGEPAFTYDLLEKHNPFSEGSTIFTAERIVLYKTNLGKVPKYEPITLFPLGFPGD